MWLALCLGWYSSCVRGELREYCILSAKPACMEPPSDETMMVVRCGSQCGGLCVFLLRYNCKAAMRCWSFFKDYTFPLERECQLVSRSRSVQVSRKRVARHGFCGQGMCVAFT